MQRSLLFFCIGSGLTVVGMVLLCTWTRIYSFILKKKLALSPHSESFESWKQPSVSVNMDIYLFNCTNPHQMMERDFKPDLVQLGPYRFLEKNKKVYITWNSNHTITYQVVRYYQYDIENSNGSLHDKFTTLNSAALTASHETRYKSYLSALPVSAAIRVFGKSVWITKSAGEFLIDGYEDPLLTTSNLLTSFSSSKVRPDRIGVIYERNGSMVFDGVINMNTGEDNLTTMGNVNFHNYANKTKNFEADCGQVTGSLGEFFGSIPTRSRHIDAFIPRLCRSVPLEYLEDVTVHGVTGYRYVISERLMDNGTTDPSTRCNCGGDCLPKGVINTTQCLLSSPSYMSYPHFLDADPYYRLQLKGMNPDPDMHRIYITVEPTTGISLDAKIPIQFNMLLKPNPKIGLYQTVPTRMVPMLWIDKYFTITPEVAKSIGLLLMLPAIGYYSLAGVTLLGVILLVCSFLQRILTYKQTHLKERRHSNSQNPSSEQEEGTKKSEISPEASTLL